MFLVESKKACGKLKVSKPTILIKQKSRLSSMFLHLGDSQGSNLVVMTMLCFLTDELIYNFSN